MPNIKSAIKRVKTSEKARQRNIKTKSKIRTLHKRVMVEAENPAEPKTKEAYQAFCSALDKGVKHGIICKNTAIRKKNRAAAFLRKAAAAK